MGSSKAQGMLWGAEAQDWADLFEPTGRPLWVALLDSAQVDQRTLLLDIGCGGGGASVLAAKRGARVAGLDAAQALIEIARERVPDGDFCVGDFEQLPRRDDAFDVALASLSMQKLKLAIARAAKPFEIDTGAILLNNRFHYVTATVPSS